MSKLCLRVAKHSIIISSFKIIKKEADMDSLFCPKCKNENFKEEMVLLTECKRVMPNTRLHTDGQREASGKAKEICEEPSKSISYICETCGNTYVLQGGQLVPTWL